MNRRILTYGGYFEAFMNTLKEKEQEKIQYGLLLLKTQDRLPKKFVKQGMVCMSCVPNMEATSFGYSSYSTKARSWSCSMVFRRRARRLRQMK